MLFEFSKSVFNNNNETIPNFLSFSLFPNTPMAIGR